MEIFLREQNADGLSREEIRAALLKSLEGRTYKNVLILPPDFTRFHSNAGYITNVYYHALTDMGANVDIMPALDAMGAEQPVITALAKLLGLEYTGEKLGIKMSDEVSGVLTCNFGILTCESGHVLAMLDIRYPISAKSSELLSTSILC